MRSRLAVWGSFAFCGLSWLGLAVVFVRWERPTPSIRAERPCCVCVQPLKGGAR